MTHILSADETAALAGRLLAQRYPDADAGLAAGSLIRGGGTATSDLDIVVLFPVLPNAYRESFIFEGLPVDAFIHDPETLRAFFGKDIDAGKCAMLTMTTEGRIVGPRPAAAEAMKTEAQALLAAGPPALTPENRDLFRYLITCRLEDLEDARTWPEAVATAAWLLPTVADFILRAHGRWAATAKWVPRTLAAFDPQIAASFESAFEALFERRETGPVVAFIDQSLAPFGGRLFDGYRSEAKPEERSKFR